MATEDEVRQASAQFYAALNRFLNGDAGPMMQVWSHLSDVTALNPAGGPVVGWEQVRAGFEHGAALYSGGQITLTDPLIRVGGDLAYEIGIESGQGTLAGQPVSFGHRVTNIYRREAGGWKMVHHHTDTSPVIQEIVSRPSPSGQTS